MVSSLERSRRANELQRAITQNEISTLILCGSSYLGHKGAIRYVFDFNIVHRYAYGMFTESGDMKLFLPRVGRWLFDPARYDEILPNTQIDDNPIVQIASEIKRRHLDRSRVGIVGLRTIMQVEDYLFLEKELPEAEIFDASYLFERVRARKSSEELDGLRHTGRIAESAFEKLQEIVRPGAEETPIVGQIYKTVQEQGATDCIFLLLSGSDGKCLPYFRLPRAQKLCRGDVFIFSIEFCGPEGYWIELSRMFAVGGHSQSEPAKCAIESLRDVASALRHGTRVNDVQEKVKIHTQKYGLRTGHISGHGIGLDVIERPFIGELTKPSSFFNIEAPLDDGRDIITLERGMVVSFHPHIVAQDMSDAAYIADTYIVGETAGSSLFRIPQDVIFV